MEASEQSPEPTNVAAGSIKAIGKDTVHKICSGQVVLSLAIAVKELVENAIDAEATLVEVRLHEQGLESLEVSDNGSGVSEHNLQGMTAKYHTSKLREFVDLQEVQSFGFRGEALSSLCALAEMSIVTRHKDTDVATRMELDHEGNIKQRTSCARSVGTTVVLRKLFATLPVRQRDFARNIKKEFARMCQILQAYCLVAKGVRIICTNQTAKGGKSVIVQTHGASDVLANIAAVFGSRQTSDVVALKPTHVQQDMTEESLLAELCNEAGDSMQISGDDVAHLKAHPFQLEGYVSSCSHGAGRSSKDRQYFYVNSRPCEPKNIAKVVNEFYHRYNVHQFPFVYLNVLTARSAVDVNLTPDKRQLLVHNEKILLLAIKKALLNTYGLIPATYKLQNASIVSMLGVETKAESSTNASEADESATTTTEAETGADVAIPISSTQRFMDVLTQWKHTGDTIGQAPRAVATAKRKCADEIEVRTLKLQKIHDFLQAKPESEGNATATDDSAQEDTAVSPNGSFIDVRQLKRESAEYDALVQGTLVERIDCKVGDTAAQARLHFIAAKPIDDDVADADTEGEEDNLCSDIETTPTMPTINIALDGSDTDSDDGVEARACSEICTTLAEIELSVQAEDSCNAEESRKAKLERLRFKSAINPSQNQKAEDELQREITKASFACMEIIGQFNLGFIIVRLDDDLFIVDQHATDEKYNFETLQQRTRLQHQMLAVPQPLQLTAVNELVLLDHLAVFEANGFKFQIDMDAPATKKVRLLGKPFSRNWEFGKEDIDELIFMLQDAPDDTAICRPSRIRAMFASRACRSSVMIGQALNRSTMRRLITHMGEIEQPWNCPHGRPTMRHLINIEMLMDTAADKTSETN